MRRHCFSEDSKAVANQEKSATALLFGNTLRGTISNVSCDHNASVLRLEPRFLCDHPDPQFHSDALAKAVLFVLFSPFKKEKMMTLVKLQNRGPEVVDQVIRIDAQNRDKIREDVQTQIGSNSFQPDQDADVLADIGASAISKFLDRKARTKLEDFGMGLGDPFVILEGLSCRSRVARDFDTQF